MDTMHDLQPYVDFFTGETMKTELGREPEPKRRFIPSKWEHKRIMKIVRAIRNGWIKPKAAEVEKPKCVTEAYTLV